MILCRPRSVAVIRAKRHYPVQVSVCLHQIYQLRVDRGQRRTEGAQRGEVWRHPREPDLRQMVGADDIDACFQPAHYLVTGQGLDDRDVEAVRL